VLLYDFGLAVGDSIRISHSFTDTTGWTTLYVDSVGYHPLAGRTLFPNFDNLERPRLVYNLRSEFGTYYWAEGIGSTCGPLYTGYGSVGEIKSLTDFNGPCTSGCHNKVEKEIAIPEAFSVGPNPFTRTLVFTNKATDGPFTVSIYNIKGELVKQFANVRNGAVVWNAEKQPAGVYILKVVTGMEVHNKRIVLIR
jgi:hypothetical protein